MRRIKPLDNRNGMSLVEILAALVVFTIGILTVAKVFPGGFGIVKQGEYATIAGRLAQAQVEQLKNLSANLPAGIYCMVPSGNPCTPTGILTSPPSGVGTAVSNPYDPDNLSPLLDKNSSPYDQYYFGDINKWRHVEGESTQIPAPSETSSDGGSIYIPMFSPLICPDSQDTRYSFWTTDSDERNSKIAIYSGPLDRVAIPASGVPYLNGDFQYSIDYKAGKLYIAPEKYGYARNFTIKYSYWQDQGAGESPRIMTTTQTISVVDSTASPMPNYTIENIPGLPSGYSVVPGSETIRREFHRAYAKEQAIVGSSQYLWGSSDTDPYAYKIMNPCVGTISFNPIGYGQTLMTSRGRIPFKAYIDYDAADWHIIREEHKLPEAASAVSNPGIDKSTNPELNIQLALGSIKRTTPGAAHNPNAYVGLYRSYLEYDLLVTDLTDGETYGSNGPTVDQIPSTSQASLTPWYNPSKPSDFDAFKVDYASGIVRLHPYFAGHAVRIHYKADHDWGVQVYTAYNLFSQSYAADPDAKGNVPYDQFLPEYSITGGVIDVNSTGIGSRLEYKNYPKLTGKIFFGKCYFGRSVAVDYTYLPDTTGVPVEVRGQILQVQGSDKNWNVDLGYYLSHSLGLANAKVLRINHVYGVTLGVRVVYKNTLTANAPWRVKSLDTYLLRSAQ